MAIGFCVSGVLRKLIIELVEFFVAAQFVPLAISVLWEIVSIGECSAFFPECQEPVRLVQVPTHLLSSDGLYQILFFSSLVIYVVAHVIRLGNPAKYRWSVRRKTGIVLTLVTFGYMTCFAVLITAQPIIPIEPWVTMYAFAVFATVYGFGVRYAANKVLRRLQRFGIR